MRYANQRRITINRELPNNNSRNKHLTIYCKNLYAAMRNLSGVAFKLYCYLCSFKDRETIEYTAQDFIDESGVGSTSARDAVRTLIDKGYLFEIKENEYIFHEVPDDWEYY